MNTEEALEFLRAHQPMPDDETISDYEAATFARVLKHLETRPDRRAIPLLVGSVGKKTTLGMYEHIRFALEKFSPTDLELHLRAGLREGNLGAKYRCCCWALDFDLTSLSSEVRALSDHADPDIRDAVEAYVSDVHPE